ncbi:MAG: hypothetical protein LBG08_04665 [Spirochaetaceae bacterium]|nr:hypothetical protein [Spirochaetaceae bacterium]
MCLMTLFFSSCIGVKTNITIRDNGTGTIALEYRISRTVDSLGKLDGNEGWPPLPVGKADFERTITRIDGLRLTSFSTRDDETDRVIRVKMDFSGPEALIGFLDVPGQRAQLIREEKKHCLSLTLGAGTQNQDPELMALTETVFRGYAVELDIAFPRDITLTLIDGSGRQIDAPPAGNIRKTGRNLRFSAPTAALLSTKEPVLMEIRW